MKLYLVRHEERVSHVGLIKHKDYIFQTKELAIDFCQENSICEDEDWIQKDSYRRTAEGASATEMLVIEEIELHQSVPDIKDLWEG